MQMVVDSDEVGTMNPYGQRSFMGMEKCAQNCARCMFQWEREGCKGCPNNLASIMQNITDIEVRLWVSCFEGDGIIAGMQRVGLGIVVGAILARVVRQWLS